MRANEKFKHSATRDYVGLVFLLVSTWLGVSSHFGSVFLLTLPSSVTHNEALSAHERDAQALNTRTHNGIDATLRSVNQRTVVPNAAGTMRAVVPGVGIDGAPVGRVCAACARPPPAHP